MNPALDEYRAATNAVAAADVSADLAQFAMIGPKAKELISKLWPDFPAADEIRVHNFWQDGQTTIARCGRRWRVTTCMCRREWANVDQKLFIGNIEGCVVSLPLK